LGKTREWASSIRARRRDSSSVARKKKKIQPTTEGREKKEKLSRSIKYERYEGGGKGGRMDGNAHSEEKKSILPCPKGKGKTSFRTGLARGGKEKEEIKKSVNSSLGFE